jgi:hypothetical protein
MQAKGYPKLSLKIFAVAGILFLGAVASRGQETRSSASSGSSASEAPAEVRALSDLIRGSSGPGADAQRAARRLARGARTRERGSTRPSPGIGSGQSAGNSCR